MLSFEPELEQLRPILGDARADALIARERREVFSLYPELRIAAWAGAMLLASAAGIVLKNNLERIGPLALAMLIAVAACACYAWVWWRRARATVADDYVLLLGGLLVSADLAFVEAQFHLLDRHWPRHFLILAIAHGAGAYAYRSRTLLSLSLAALAAWMGVERRTFDVSRELSLRAFLTAALVIAWRELHRRLLDDTAFLRVFEHFAANLTLWGGLALASDPGYAITIVLAALVVRWGFARRAESFVLYGVVYAMIAAIALLARHLSDATLALAIFVAIIAAVVVLINIRTRFHERRA